MMLRAFILSLLTLVSTVVAAQNYEYNDQRYLAQIHLTKAIHDSGVTGKDVVIGAIDGHPALGHPDISTRGAVHRLFTGTTFAPTSWNADHSSVSTSLMTGRLNGTGIVGVAPEAYVWTVPIWSNPPERSLYGSNAGLLRAYRLLIGTYKAKIINHELVSTNPQGEFEALWGTGRLNVIAQIPQVAFIQPGANNGRTLLNQYYTNNLSTLDHLVIVGAVDQNNRIASFSNQPGERCFTRSSNYRAAVCEEAAKLKYKFIVAPGVNIIGAGSPGGYLTWTGQSFSSPLVAGTLALMFQKRPTLVARDAVRILFETADDLGEPGVDGVYGRGLINVEAALAALQ